MRNFNADNFSLIKTEMVIRMKCVLCFDKCNRNLPYTRKCTRKLNETVRRMERIQQNEKNRLTRQRQRQQQQQN